MTTEAMNDENGASKLGIVFLICMVFAAGSLAGQHYGSILFGSGIGFSLGVSVGLLIDWTRWLSRSEMPKEIGCANAGLQQMSSNP